MLCAGNHHQHATQMSAFKSMTKEQFNSLSRGDIVRARFSNESWMVDGVYGDRITVVATGDMTNPEEWELILKADYSRP